MCALLSLHQLNGILIRPKDIKCLNCNKVFPLNIKFCNECGINLQNQFNNQNDTSKIPIGERGIYNNNF